MLMLYKYTNIYYDWWLFTIIEIIGSIHNIKLYFSFIAMDKSGVINSAGRKLLFYPLGLMNLLNKKFFVKNSVFGKKSTDGLLNGIIFNFNIGLQILKNYRIVYNH